MAKSIFPPCSRWSLKAIAASFIARELKLWNKPLNKSSTESSFFIETIIQDKFQMPKKISDSGKKIGLPFWGNCAIILPMVLLANLLPYIQIVLSVILVLSIMLQRQGAELGGAWGGSGESFHTTRRGFE